MLWAEIQMGITRMQKKDYQQLGSTAACVMRAVADTSDSSEIPIGRDEEGLQDDELGTETRKPKLYLGDSWFGSAKAAANIRKAGHHAILNVKTNHSRIPKKFLEDTMKDFPGGTWITLEGRAEKEEVDLICIGYKYNKKKVLTFICTKGAGSTKGGEPYEAKFPDKFGNVCVRYIARPECVTTYFKFSNCVDLHNQARQYDLALEKKWITHNGYFRLYTTMVGWIVTDLWKVYKVSNDIPIHQYADELAGDMIDYADSIKQNGKFLFLFYIHLFYANISNPFFFISF